MSRNVRTRLLMTILLGLTLSPAARAESPLPRLEDVNAPVRTVLDRQSGAATDSLFVFGGPGVLEGKFQDAAGQPDRQGWTGVDRTVPDPSHWQVSDFQAAELDPLTPGNHAWWCGAVLESCGEDDPPEGYGPDWIDFLDWYGTVANPNSPVTVQVQASALFGFEPGEEYLYLLAETADGMQQVRYWTNVLTPLEIDESVTLNASSYVGPGSDQVHLRFAFYSDGGWDDADCMWPTAGAAWLDLIQVHFDQGSGPVQIGWTETCEAGDPLQWQALQPPGVGDFSQVRSGLQDGDPAAQNATPQFTFIDDGVVVPGTGGSLCTTWCYGPGGYIVNPGHGLSETGEYLHNEIWSPVVTVPDDSWNAAVFAFDQYVHCPIADGAPYIFGIWHVRSTTDPTGQTGWSAWRDRNTVLYGDAKYARTILNVTDLLEPGFRCVQLALGAQNYRYNNSTDGTPAPYFDNVSLKVYRRDAPSSVLLRADGTGEYPTIQSALDAVADGDTILLADGVYTGDGNRDLFFRGRDVVIRSQNGPRNCILDVEGSETENHRAVWFYYEEGPGAILSGLTLTGGYVAGDYTQGRDSGGAVLCGTGSSPTIENCVFEGNSAFGTEQNGGAVACYRSAPRMVGCIFEGNASTNGGAVGVWGEAAPRLENCLLTANETPNYGGAIYAETADALVTVISCTISDNVNSQHSGALYSRNNAEYVIDRSILAFAPAGYSVSANYPDHFTFTCTNLWGFPYGDWYGPLAVQLGVDGNLSADPLFCGDLRPALPFGLHEDSPCAPEVNPSCGLIGYAPVSCGDWSAAPDPTPAAAPAELYPGSPNPFNPSTTLAFRLPEPGRIDLAIYTVDGRRVRTLASGSYEAGRHEATWDGRDDQGRTLACGVFFCRLQAPTNTETTRLVLLK